MPEAPPTDAQHARASRPGSRPAASAAAAAAAAAALAVLLWRLEWTSLAGLGSVHAWSLLLAAAGLQLLTVPLKAVGWRVTLAAVHPAAVLPLRAVTGPVAVGALFNLVLAGRVGDAARVLLVHARLRRAGRPAAVSLVLGSAITETLVSTAAWVALVAVAGALVPLPPEAWGVVAAVAVGAALVALAAWRGWGRVPREGRRGSFGRVAAGARRVWAAVAEGHLTLRRPAVVMPLAAAAVAGWVAQWAVVYAVLAAFDVADAVRGATLVLVSTSVAQTLPVVPGNLGVFQAAAALPLVASSGVAATTAVAIGVVLQLVQTVPVAIAGAVVAARRGEDLGELWRAALAFRRSAEGTGR
jgi:uncharacterized membrane protein YbhN (UPF0104 family)